MTVSSLSKNVDLKSMPSAARSASSRMSLDMLMLRYSTPSTSVIMVSASTFRSAPAYA